MTTATQLGDLTLEEAAKHAAGNWGDFECFVWFRQDELERPEDWMIHYSHHRDSGLLDQSNAQQIQKALEPFTDGDDPDVVEESHDHWAVGHVDGFSLRVFRDKQITEAFRTFHQLMQSLADYPILNEEHYGELEHQATTANIVDAAWRISDEFNLPVGWEYDVHSWLADHEPSEVESVDDQGGYPTEEALRRAFEALGFEEIEEE